MTLENYLSLREAGLKNVSVCFPAALDAVSSVHSVSPETYCRWHNGFIRQLSLGENSKVTRRRRLEVFGEVSSYRIRNLIGRRVKDADQCEEVLEKLKQGGWRVIIATRTLHACGLRPVDKGWQIVNPDNLAGQETVYSSREIFAFLAQPRERVKGKPVGNILAIPPEKKVKS